MHTCKPQVRIGSLLRLLGLGMLVGLGVTMGLSGCGSGTSSTPTPPPALVTLTTNPDPPRAGPIELTARVTDAGGQPLDGAEVFISSSHTEMVSMALNGKATPEGNGRYTLKTEFRMNGRWKVTVQVKKLPINFNTDVTLEFK